MPVAKLSGLAAAILRNDPNCVFLDHCFERLIQDSEQVVATFTNGETLQVMS
jgi:hypothetical protein